MGRTIPWAMVRDPSSRSANPRHWRAHLAVGDAAAIAAAEPSAAYSQVSPAALDQKGQIGDGPATAGGAVQAERVVAVVKLPDGADSDHGG